MTTRVFWERSGLGVEASLVRQAGDRGLTLVHSMDATGIIEQNKRDAIGYSARWQHTNPGGFRHVARIPFPEWLELQSRGIVQGLRVVDERAFLRHISDPDNRKLRCDNGARLA